ncbi:MAG: single-stranded DNA-binding protein [Dysgonamonadaceae bacterium]|jgi:single-strand DNA-binding protein|nr:single-stranded DNA-binding protein [Dysgonamonadaceae bacterium]
MSINKVILVGHVGKDPDVRYFDNGGAVANFSLATTERGYELANGTKVPEKTEWHNIVLWRGLAETAEKYVKKGSKIYIEGKIRSRSYDDANGNKRYVTEIYGDTMEMLDRRPDGAGGSRPLSPEPPDSGGTQAQREQKTRPSQSPNPPSDTDSASDGEKADDLPF